MIASIAASVFSLILSILALLHLAWALGSRWPAKTESDLAAHVLGTGSQGSMPPPLACVVVTIALSSAALLPLSTLGWVTLPLSPALERTLLWVVVGVFTVRGLYGYVDHRVRPETQSSPFVRLNRRFYSPLCLSLAGLAALTVTAVGS